MGNYDVNSWKERIDPNFDNLIRVYADFIRLSHICSDDKNKRYLSIDNESLKVLERKSYPPLFKQIKYNAKNVRKTVRDIVNLGASKDIECIMNLILNVSKGLIELGGVKNFAQRQKTANELCNEFKMNIFTMINGLPNKESRDYYRKCFDIYQTPEKCTAFLEGKTEKELTKAILDMGSDLTALVYQTMFRNYWESENNSSPNGKKINKLNMIKLAMLEVYNLISKVKYKKSLYLLIEEGRKGNEESLFNAIHIDKTLFEECWVRKRIRRAFYSGDSRFFKRLGMEISKPPLGGRVTYEEAILILLFLWEMGLYRLEYREIMDLFKENGIMIPKDRHGNESMESLSKLIWRLKNEDLLLDYEKIIEDL